MACEKKLLICQDSVEGIFTAVYDGWLWSARGYQIEIRVCEPEYPELFCTTVEISPDSEKALKVARSVREKLVKVWHEIHRFYGFVRFRELGGDVLYSCISPQNDILEFLEPHFSDRFPNENWMIYDQNRHKVLTHPRGGECTVYREVIPNQSREGLPADEDAYEDLWKAFCRYITIPERKNPSLQKQFVPLKFRSNTPEFS